MNPRLSFGPTGNAEMCSFPTPRLSLWPAGLEGRELGNKMQGRSAPVSLTAHPLPPPFHSQQGGKWCVKHSGDAQSVKEHHRGDTAQWKRKMLRQCACCFMTVSSATGHNDGSAHKSPRGRLKSTARAGGKSIITAKWTRGWHCWSPFHNL